jgi:hypothetical protein
VPSRKQRASDTQTIVARWFAGEGWPFAEPVGAGRPGTDVTGMPGLCVEVKARRQLDLTGWLRQHASNGRGGLPFVIHRPDGYGPARIADWPVTMRLDDFTRLLRQAGYGEPERTS